ncbi:AsmA-like C-terminal region-containing protein [Pleomorphovibrio marinus]|uniref:AsmA-like C-terminal region-containing protein n=1 Tax=Pleomorphovibrio marinus TaxID=2164132 RepID=UPI000E0C614E|nr:AsmA-like C-terminal region-containing protein [Pleomorphovibrio marinus]
MKKAIYVLFLVITVFLLALVILPFLFKDKIVERVDRELQSSINAEVYYDVDKIGLSVFKRFPHISLTLGDFGIRGNAPFENDTLVHVGNFQVDFHLWSVIFDEYPELSGLHLKDGEIYVKVLPDGLANYDITYPSEEPSDLAEPSNFKLGINLIEIDNLSFVYDDREMDFFLALAEMDLEGSGDFTLSVYDLFARGGGKLVQLDYEDVNYLSQKDFTLDSRIHVDLDDMLFGFEDAVFSLNEFGMNLEGSIGLPEEGIAFDLNFSAEDNSFKSILSLVPGIYTESFAGLRTSGEMDVKGFFRGLYSEDSFPSFQLALVVEEGMFQYPDLPRPVQHVNLNLLVDNPSGIIEETSIDLSTFNLSFGDQPLSGRFLLKNLVTYDMDGQLVGRLNLEELTSIFPVEGITVRGDLAVDAKASGRYDTIANVIPMISADVGLANGFLKSSDYPAAIENINFQSKISNPTGNMNDFSLNVPQFGLSMEGEPLEGRLSVSDFDKIIWDLSLHGGLDLGKVVAIFPMEDVILEGIIKADIDSKGSYADVEANRYDRISTSGDLAITDFYYADKDLPQGIRIRNATSDFSPSSINLTRFDARFGESPVSATGSLSNYMNYMFAGGTEVLKGNLDLQSSRFNVNEWLVSGGETSADTGSLEVISLPRTIDFTMKVQADEVLYDNLVLKNARGTMTLNDGVLAFSNFGTKALGGDFAFNGSYDSRDISQPLFDFTFDVKALSIQESFKTFNTVQTLAPIAQHLTGNFTTKFSLSGLLGQDMMPVLSSLDGKGLINLAETSIRDSQLIRGITSISRLNDTGTINLRPFTLRLDIEDGMLMVPPFDVRLWDYPTNIQGSTGFNGSINYLVSMQVPAEKLGSSINNLVSGITGSDLKGTMIPLAFNIGGTYSSPRIGLASGENLESYLTNMLRSRASTAATKIQEDLTAEFKAKEDSVRQELRQRAEVAKDSVRNEAERMVDQGKERAVEEVRGLLRGLSRGKNK